MENADDPDAEERKLLVAYEVLTDPEERYLYELYGHDEYITKRVDADEVTEIEAASGGGGLTPVFGAEDDTGSDSEIFDPSDPDPVDETIIQTDSGEDIAEGNDSIDFHIHDKTEEHTSSNKTNIRTNVDQIDDPRDRHLDL